MSEAKLTAIASPRGHRRDSAATPTRSAPPTRTLPMAEGGAPDGGNLPAQTGMQPPKMLRADVVQLAISRLHIGMQALVTETLRELNLDASCSATLLSASPLRQKPKQRIRTNGSRPPRVLRDASKSSVVDSISSIRHNGHEAASANSEIQPVSRPELASSAADSQDPAKAEKQHPADRKNLSEDSQWAATPQSSFVAKMSSGTRRADLESSSFTKKIDQHRNLREEVIPDCAAAVHASFRQPPRAGRAASVCDGSSSVLDAAKKEEGDAAAPNRWKKLGTLWKASKAAAVSSEAEAHEANGESTSFKSGDRWLATTPFPLKRRLTTSLKRSPSSPDVKKLGAPELQTMIANRRRAVRGGRRLSSSVGILAAASTRHRKASCMDANAAQQMAFLESRLRQAQLRMQGQDPELMKALFGLDADSLLWKEDMADKVQWYIWHPLSWSRFCWDCILAILILVSTIETPFSIAFLSTSDFTVGHRIFIYSIDGIMLLDVVSNFFSGYVDDDERVVMDHKKIVKRYLKTWFFIEFISSLPIADLLPVSRALLRSLRIFRLVRLLRLRRLLRYIARWQDDVRVSHTSIRLIKLFVAVFLYIHLNACLQFGTPALQDFPSDSWVHLAGLPISRLPEPDAVFMCYTVSFFTAFSNALCVSYGIVTPSRLDELWIMLLSMVTGASMYAVALAVACNILQSVDHASRRYQNTLDELTELMRVRCFPKSLKERVRKLLEIHYPNRRMFSSTMLERELSSSLSSEVRVTQCAALFAVTPIFQDADPSFLAAMSDTLEIEYSQPGDWLTREREIVRNVIFIQQGRVEVLIEGEPVAELVEGAYVGEIATLGLNEAHDTDDDDDPLLCAATASVRAIEVTTVFLARRQRFRALIQHYPEVKNAMRVVARLRYQRGHVGKSSGEMGHLEGNRYKNPIQRTESRRWQAISSLTTEDMEEYVTAQRISAIQQHDERKSTNLDRDISRQQSCTSDVASNTEQGRVLESSGNARSAANNRRMSVTEMRRNRKGGTAKSTLRTSLEA